MSRLKAFALHFLGSICVLSLVFILIQQVWYPGKLFTLAAGLDLLKLIIGVDLIIGPLIMLIIFDTKKKSLKFDVVVVLLCQLSFMAYGFWTMFVSRPVYFVFAENRFFLVRANEIDSNDLLKAKSETFKTMPWLGPVYVGTKEPNDVKIKNDIVLSGLSGMGIQDLPQYFIPYEEVAEEVLAASTTSNKLKVDMETKQRAFDYEKSHPGRHVLFSPMVNKRTPLIVVLDAKTAQVVDLI